MYKYCK